MAKTDLTAERVRELFHYDQNTGDFTWKKRASQRATQIVIGSKAGHVSDQGYIRIYIGRANYLAHRLAWYYTHGYMPKVIDHINGIRTDNRISNLRPATHALNMQNRIPTRGGKSVIGVTRTPSNMYVARIYATLCGNHMPLYLGTYTTETEAQSVYRAAKELLHPGSMRGRDPTVSQGFNVADMPISMARHSDKLCATLVE